MSFDIILKGKVLTEGGPVLSYVCIKDGVIADVCRTIPGHDCRVNDHSGCFLLPGCIDSHVHFRDPGLTKKEDLYSGSVSAAFGGVTSFIDMPNTLPPTLDLRTFVDKSMKARDISVVDFGFNLGILPGSNPDDVFRGLRSKGASFSPLGLKVFLGESTGSLVFRPLGALSPLFPSIQDMGVPLSVHAEDGDMISSVPKDGDGPERSFLERHCASRSSEAEVSAIIKIAEVSGGHREVVHLLHISSAIGMEWALSTGTTIEVTPHHLLLDLKWGQNNLEMASLAKVNPPIRTTKDRAALWDAVLAGKVDTIGSDHAPHLLSEKDGGPSAPSGIPGTETMLPLLFYRFMEKGLDLRVLVKLLGSGPAKRFSLTRKGSLGPGRDADIVVICPEDVRKIRAEDLHSKCGWTVYENWKAVFPRRVYSRGELIIEDENLTADKGRGKDLSIK